MGAHLVGTVDEFPEGEGRSVDVDGIDVAVFNLEGTLYGIQNMCFHKRLPLHFAGQQPYISESVDEEYTRGAVCAEDETISCPYHGMRFDLTTGENPATGRRIATYDIEVRGEDVYVVL